MCFGESGGGEQEHGRTERGLESEKITTVVGVETLSAMQEVSRSANVSRGSIHVNILTPLSEQPCSHGPGGIRC
jgi:hypothetical protein